MVSKLSDIRVYISIYFTSITSWTQHTGAHHSRQSGGNKMEDTVTLARQEREKQGLWEAEVSYGGEVDLHQHLAGCNKNPGHQKFVPVDQFNVDHLPPGCQDNDLVDIVRAISDLTVRVSVKYVSEGRPKTFPGGIRPYPCYKNRGGNMMRVGTGWVWKVSKCPQEEDNHFTTCPCQECLISPTPKTQFAHIYIDTAAHVVYDSLEAAHTTCHLFFDKGGTPDACSGVVTLSGGSVVVSDVYVDWCEMIFVTHDIDLADRLDKMVIHRATLRERWEENLGRLETKKLKSSSAEEILPDARDDLIVIVSHPHGCSKQVSFGYCIDREEEWREMYPRIYTTATCPGSSGAWVWSVKGGRSGFYWGHGRVHSGNCEGNKDLNYCNNYLHELVPCPGGQLKKGQQK